MKICNLYAGPGTGKSTTAAALFAELKYRGVNCEYIQEYAKDAAWERRGQKFFQCQEYIFGKQHFRMFRTANEVELMVTDSPILMGLVYAGKNYPLPSLNTIVREAYNRYDNLDVFLRRADFGTKKYNPAGRNQTADEAVQKDGEIRTLLSDQGIQYHEMTFGRDNPLSIIDLMINRGWNVPAA